MSATAPHSSSKLSKRDSPTASADFPIIGIGASAGGIDAFHSFFARMPAESGMAFVVVLHLPPDRRSMLSDILSRWTPMQVADCEEGMRVRQNCVYVAPPHALVTLKDQQFGVHVPPSDHDKIFRPIDSFFDSLGAELREQAVGIVLSGSGSDGALGLKAIKACGGLTIAQGSDGTVPQYGEMPAGAIATGAVDLIAPVEQIPDHLMRIKRSPMAPASVETNSNDTDTSRLEICAILRAQLGHDFSDYRTQTFLRRVERRMQVVGASSLQDYVARLKNDHNEVVFLFRDLLIRVTSFFRDAQTFEVLQQKVIPHLFEGKNADGTVRVWVPGCATGEEAYSLAMLLREHLDGLKGAPKVQVFATDIDDSAIATARVARYPATLLEGLSAPRRERFFRLSQGSYIVAKEVRDLCVFSAHNLVRDPPFSRMDLVSCRNLLIYMNADLQAKVIPAFHYSLVRGGILLLGGSESAAQHRELFESLDKVARIFRRRDTQSPELNLHLRADSPRQKTLAAQDRPLQMNQYRSQQPGDHHARSSDGTVTGSADAPRLPAFEELLEPLALSTENLLRLQDALRGTRDEFEALEEEHQTALEELRSSNEELHSVNEEMQSTNEELETSKEELQSLNEELHTVNTRLTEKIDEIDKSNTDLRNLFTSIEIATVFLDRNLIIRGFTPAIATIYNLIPSDEGRPLADIVSRLDHKNLREDVDAVLASQEPLERRVMREDRSAHYIMRVLPYREPDSTISGILITFVDVTSIVQAEAALVEADVRKDVFLATLSHELRNPLAPIRSAAQLLQASNLGHDDLARAQAIIVRQVRHMSSLLDDLLDVSRITRGAFLLKKEYANLRTLIEPAVEAAQLAINQKQHTLRVDYPADPIVLEVDPVRITQVLANLLTNAAKYTPAGGLIALGSRLEGPSIVIFVRDNGMGIETGMMAKIFAMFARVESEDGLAEGGLGIGLALSKGLVELHGGRLEVHSAGLGRGSEFRVILPRSLIVDAAAREPRETHQEGGTPVARRILIADDNRDGAESLAMLLRLSGHAVHVAHTGKQAFDLAQEIKPDIAILDIGMPDGNGYDVARQIRHEAWGEHMTLIAATGWGQEEDKRRALAAGFNHHLTKPVDADHLEQLFTKKGS
jgi:two-component system CheB/CheR fusion protein